MPFPSFYELYKNDKKARLKLNTWLTKEHIIEKKILPYFQGKQMNDIKATDVMACQNARLSLHRNAGVHKVALPLPTGHTAFPHQ